MLPYTTGIVYITPTTRSHLKNLKVGDIHQVHRNEVVIICIRKERFGSCDCLKFIFIFLQQTALIDWSANARIELCSKYPTGQYLNQSLQVQLRHIVSSGGCAVLRPWDWSNELHAILIDFPRHSNTLDEPANHEHIGIISICVNPLGSDTALGSDSNQMEGCVICKENKECLAMIPCGHVCYCIRCATRVCDFNCPMCRKGITNIIRTYP